MEFCVLIEPHNGATYDDQLAVALHAERLGFAGFFRSDHFIAGIDNGQPGPTDTWVTLAGLARETSAIRLGSLVTSATFRHPSHLAVTVAQVDQMSGGRVELGIGAGWWRREHEATGIDFPAAGIRFDRLEEQLEILDGLWSTPIGESYSFTGAQYTLKRSPALPKPQQASVPILIGGSGKIRTPALAARWAREFNSGWEPPLQTGIEFDRVAEACDRIGRDRSTLRLSTVQTLCAGDTDADREAWASRNGIDVGTLSGMVGDENDLREQVATFADVGVERLYVEVLDPRDLDQLSYFAAAVGLARRS